MPAKTRKPSAAETRRAANKVADAARIAEAKVAAKGHSNRKAILAAAEALRTAPPTARGTRIILLAKALGTTEPPSPNSVTALKTRIAELEAQVAKLTK